MSGGSSISLGTEAIVIVGVFTPVAAIIAILLVCVFYRLRLKTFKRRKGLDQNDVRLVEGELDGIGKTELESARPMQYLDSSTRGELESKHGMQHLDSSTAVELEDPDWIQELDTVATTVLSNTSR